MLPGLLRRVAEEYPGTVLKNLSPLSIAAVESPLAKSIQDFESYEEIEEEEEEDETQLPLEQIITLRIGVFFDGTGNNSANSQSVAECRAEDVELESLAEDIREHCARHGYDGDGSSPDNSYGNDVTNVARLYGLYTDQTAEVLPLDAEHASLAVYLEGVGTASGSADSLYSQGTGRGDTGVLARVLQCPEKILEQIRFFRQNNPDALINKIEVDIFGFSRGAAAARHFANDLLKGESSLLAARINTTADIFTSDFAWRPHQDISLGFIGLFDTVAGLVTPLRRDFSPANGVNYGLQLGIAPHAARKVVQLVAGDEYRHNFALNSAGAADILLPGAHSDIGGGYLPSSQEKLLLSRPRRSRVVRSQPHDRTSAYLATIEELNSRMDELKHHGLELDVVPWTVDLPYNRKRDLHPEKYVYCAIASRREVRGELSLIYMRIMRELAVREGVPFDIINERDPSFRLPEELQTISSKLQAYALGETSSQSLTEAEKSLLHRRYIHLSAHWNAALGQSKNGMSIFFVNRPAQSDIRRIHPND